MDYKKDLKNILEIISDIPTGYKDRRLGLLRGASDRIDELFMSVLKDSKGTLSGTNPYYEQRIIRWCLLACADIISEAVAEVEAE